MLQVLVVDNSQDGANSLAKILRIMGADVHVAYDGPSALSTIRSTRPPVALVDIGMPGMDGYELARQVRADPSLSRVRLISVTGWMTYQDQEMSRAAGFDDHWIKPLSLVQLRAVLVNGAIANSRRPTDTPASLAG